LRRHYSIVLTLIAVFAMHLSAQPKGEFIFPPGSTSFPSSHASTLVELSDRSILSAWFGGTAEGANDVAIWSSRQTNSTWSKPVELAREPGVACWNPVLFHAPNPPARSPRLWLYYKFGTDPQNWTAARKYSDDEGTTWSPAEHLPAGLVGPVRAKPLVLPDGTIVSGSSTESYHSWAVWIERSKDNGKSWAKIGPIAPAPSNPASNLREGIIQPSVVWLGETHLRLYARSTEVIGRVVVSDSYDEGLTWTEARPIDVPNPNSGIDAVALKDHRVVLIYNNTTKGRSPLNLAVSNDGEHFKMFLTLEDEPGEFSYPAMIVANNGDLCMTYTWNRKSIRFVRLPQSAIPKLP
jgi:predicted neuraminidase